MHSSHTTVRDMTMTVEARGEGQVKRGSAPAQDAGHLARQRLLLGDLARAPRDPHVEGHAAVGWQRGVAPAQAMES